MKRLIVSASLLLLFVSLSAFAKEKKSAAQAGVNTDQAIIALESQSREAALKGDGTFAESHLATDFMRVYPDGTVGDRQQMIDATKNGTVKYSSIDFSDQKVRVYGDTAIVTAKASVKGTRNGQSLDGDYYSTRVWVKQGGQWKLASFHTTKISGM